MGNIRKEMTIVRFEVLSQMEGLTCALQNGEPKFAFQIDFLSFFGDL